MRTAHSTFLLFVLFLTACQSQSEPVSVDKSEVQSSSMSIASSSSQKSAKQNVQNDEDAIHVPLVSAKERITKKMFGTFVSPSKSPVSPEKFTGYHTGVDFEILPGEDKEDVHVFAICDGSVRIIKNVRGYGGLLIQECTISDTVVTVLYGHLRLSSVSVKSGDELKSGQEFAVLGDGFSRETDGERKHLHLSIHNGAAIEYRGYVQKKSDLSAWLDPAHILSAVWH